MKLRRAGIGMNTRTVAAAFHAIVNDDETVKEAADAYGVSQAAVREQLDRLRARATSTCPMCASHVDAFGKTTEWYAQPSARDALVALHTTGELEHRLGLQPKSLPRKSKPKNR